jgi:hypothetical protein
VCINTPESTVWKTFFTTQHGRIGLGNEVKPGSEVCILFGGQDQFLLREAETGIFELIEYCYVNSLKDGKAMKEYEEGKHVKTTFGVC